jgi:hypothetical protein
MSTRFSLPVGGELLVYRETSSSTKENTQDSYFISSLNALDTDRVRLEGITGVTVDGDESVNDINYSSNRLVSDATSLIEAVSALDANTVSQINLDNVLKYVRLGYVTSVITAVDTLNDHVTVTAHPYTTEARAKLRALGGDVPAGLNETDFVFLRSVDVNTLSFHPTAADATANTNKIDITDTGSGTIQIISSPTSFKEGDMIYDGDLKLYRRGVVERIASYNMLRYFRSGCVPTYVDTDTISIGVGRWVDSTGMHLLRVTSPITVDITVSGAGGRSEAAAEAAARRASAGPSSQARMT